ESGAGKSTSINAIANYMKYTSIDEAARQNFIDLIPSKFTLGDDSDNMITISSGGIDAKAIDNERMESGKSSTKEPKSYLFKQNNTTVRFIDTPEETISLNNSRKFIYQMAEPMVDLSLNLEINIKHIQNQENELLDVNKDKLELARSLNILIDDLIMDKLPYPTTVCTANKCTTIIVKENGNQVTHYGTRCHENCQLTGVANNVTGDRILENCWAMAGTGKCAKNRTTFYKPGDGLQIMNNLLKEEFPNAQLALKSKVNCFFIDNEAYRYLVAKKEGYPFKNYQLKTFTEAWNISSAQTNDMLQRIIETTPHNLKTTFWLNMAQNFIIKLADPIVQLQRTIFANINTIKHQKECIESGNSTIDFLIKTINMKVIEQEFVNLEKPMTVCASKNCPKSKNLERKQKVKNFTLCCKDCHVQYVNEKEKGAKLLKDCIIFKNNDNKFLKNCNKCGCSFKEHMQLHRVQMAVEKEVVNPAKLKELNELLKSKEKDDNLSQRIIDVLQANIKEREEEMQTIQWVASQFGYLLNKHSNSSVTQFIEPYLKFVIEEEQVKMQSIENYPDDVFKMLKNVENVQREYSEYIENLPEENKQFLQLENIETIADTLRHLKFSGHQFGMLIDKILITNEQEVLKNHFERVGVDMS
ncbi:PREDICTED: uncharacterized protein LOC108379874, partial [Rhagoletis zephyria]|uniref:uncharacterized protein LOC108379874 n=1 Tax=Rhagoletis zephyria TaxID=28612 RepID=UPI0008117EBB